METIEYAVLAWDADEKAYVVARFERKGEALRTRDVEAAPAETVTREVPYTHPDGRTATATLTARLAPLVLPREIKPGPDGKPLWRPVVTAPEPTPHPWQRVVGPLYEIGPEEVTRYWEVEDRPVEDVRAERAATLRSDMARQVLAAIVEGSDPEPARQAGRAALERLEKAETVREAHDVAIAVEAGGPEADGPGADERAEARG